MLELALLLALLRPAQDAPVPEPLAQVTVDVSGAPLARLTQLLAGDFDVLHAHAGGRAYDVLCDAEDLERLRALGFSFELVHRDVARFYADRLAASAPEGAPSLGAWLSPPFGQGSLGGFYTAAEVASVLDQIASAYPAFVSPKFSLGTSHQGRDLWAVKVSDSHALDEDEPEVRFDAMHHAREPESMQALLWTLLYLVENYGSDPRATSIVDGREIWFVPLVNPDGYVWNEVNYPGGGGMWRKNLRDNLNGTFGVDLNRNYPYQWGYDNTGSKGAKGSDTYRGPAPASEPEVAAMVAFLSARDFRTALSTHTYSNVWLHPWGYEKLAPSNVADYTQISRHATEINEYTFGLASVVLYLANGVTIDYDQGVHGTLSWTPEIGSAADGFWPAASRIVPLAEENLEGFLRTALAAGSYAYLKDTLLVDAGDGDGYPEPGEQVELVFTVHNGGLDDAAAVSLTLESTSPFATVGNGSTSLGALSSFADGDNQSAPLTLTIDPATPVGTQVDYTVRVEWDGLSQVVPQALTAGRPVPFVVDDVETQLGWITGLPGDTATTGIWQWGNPKQTIASGNLVASPEDDATPGAGLRCFVTGNGALVNLDDVDDGHTTLVSPRIDLSSAGLARLSYARWFADLNVADDALEVSISDDDGQTWVPLETVDVGTSAWETATHFVDDHVELTDEIRLRFVASDDPDNSIAEACVDELSIEIFDAEPSFNVYGTATPGSSVAFHTASPEGGVYGVFESPGTGFFPFAQINGPLLLDPATMVLVTQGSVPAAGLARDVLLVPDDPGLVGRTLYYQALVSAPGGLWLTNRDSILFE